MFNNGNGGYSLSDIAAVSGRDNDGAWGGDGAWWIIILFLFVFCGWGNGNWGGNGGMNGATQGALTRGDLCMDMNFNDVQNGVRALNDMTSVGFANLNSTICHQQYDTAGLINSLENTVQGGFNAANIVALQGQNALQAQLAQCCCENREGQAQINYNMATNTCALTNTMNQNTRDIIDSQQAGTRAILDYLCQEKISDLQNENQALRLSASQAAQNQYLVNALRPAPVPAFAVPAPYQFGGWNNGGCCCNC